MLERYKQVFEALPHVTEIWVTSDGEFHLHPANGGEHIIRNDDLSVSEYQEDKEIKPRSSGRPKKS